MEIRECRAQGADFRGASFMNMITSRTWFCSAYITKSNLSYANFAKVVLEKCELWENRWHGAQVLGASFSGPICPAANSPVLTGAPPMSPSAI